MGRTKLPIVIKATEEEYDWVCHAAKLRGLSLQEFVKRAINATLVKQGVDAVLFAESNHV